MDELKKIADEIIVEHPQLINEIEEAWNTMQRCIKEGESKTEEEDLFYWYIHKLKRELITT